MLKTINNNHNLKVNGGGVIIFSQLIIISKKLILPTLMALFLISCGGGGGSSSSSNNNNNNNGTTPPQLTQVATQTLVVGSAANITIINTGGSLNQCTIEPNLPNNLNIAVSDNNCQITGVPVAETATRSYTITAINDLGISTTTIAIQTIITPPQLTQVATQTLVVGSAANITITNTGGQVSQCTIDPDLPNNLNLAVSNNNCQITGIATTQTATVTYTITAINNVGESTTNIGLVVKAEGTIITDIPITSISISGTNTITVGDTTQLTTVITPNNATNQNLNWSSSNEEVATVNTGGVVTALTPGEVTITTAATDGSGITRSINITVEPKYITSININGNNTITVGSATTLSATITPGDATNQNLNWSSSNNNIATVNNTGLVTALNLGEATITTAATDGSGVSAELVISVVNESVPVVTNFTAEILIDAISVGDTIGTITITNSPTIVTILENPNGYDQHFNINESGRLTIAQQLLTITYTLQVQAANDFGTTIGNLTITVSEINQLAKLIAHDSARNNKFGNSVAIYNDYMLIGAPGNSSIPGYAYLFKIDETTKEVTQLAKLIAADGRNDDQFGFSVALNDNYALIGAHFHNHNSLSNNGAAYLFDITNITPNTIITHTAKLVATDGANYDQFGISAALNNNYALIGANWHDHSGLTDNGAAYLFDITNITPNTIITHTTKLIANDGENGDDFGFSVALNNNYALIGVYAHNLNGFDNGAAYLFDITNITPNTIITHTTKLVANDGEFFDNFGKSVAIYNDYILIGAPGPVNANNIPGYAYLFRVNETTKEVTQLAKLLATDGANDDQFGISVALNNNYALIGAYFHDHSNLNNKGAAYLFDITGITPNTTITHTTKLVANDGGRGDNFGRSVALNNNYALIGAYEHDHSGLSNNGAAYIFGTSEPLTIPVQNINISGNNTIIAGDTTQLNATIIPATATNQNLNWSSSNNNIATVNNNGVVTAINPGEVTIIAAATDGSGITRSTNITVEPRYITNININGASTITVGNTTQLTTVVTPNNAPNQNLNWSSSNEEVATVNNTGLVTAISPGEATITTAATDGSSVTASINITVEPKYITSINIDGNNTIVIGSETTLSATITPNDAANQNLTWSSSNEEVATVNNTGLVTALRVGTATITVTATDGSGVTASTNITVAPIYITSINIDGNNNIVIGSETTLTATITPNDATNQNLNWSSSNETVATVDNNGLVTALNLGEVTITTAATDGSGVSSDFVISVVSESVPFVTNFTTELLIDVISVGDTIGTVTITNNPTTVTILENPNGYDQHFNIDANGRLTIAQQLLTITYTLQVQATNDFGTTIGNLTITVSEIKELAKLIAGDSTDENRFGTAVAIYNDYMLIGAPGNSSIPGYAHLFKINETTGEVTGLAKLIAADGRNNDRFGTAVALNNNYALIGADLHDHSDLTNNGAAYLFDITNITPNTTITHTTKLVANDGDGGDRFGISVALNNNYALIGAYQHDHSTLDNNGAAYLFDITAITPNTTSTHTTKLIANDGGGGDNFGISVALNNNYALIGASGHHYNLLVDNGAAYLFDITNITPNTIITHTTKLIANDGGVEDYFGRSVALNNNYALIGAYEHNHSGLSNNGAAYLFDITGITPNTIITHTTKLIANDSRVDGDNFGISVALNNNYALIGAYSHGINLNNSGAAYLFAITNITPNTTSTHITKLVANDVWVDDYFGISVALHNNYALIGAYRHDHSGLTDNGAAYVFDL